MVADVYEIIYRRGTSNDFNNLVELHTQAVDTDTLPLGDDTPKDVPSLLKRGCTPFDIPAFLRGGRIIILKKTKFMIAPQTSNTYQVRIPKKWTFTPQNMDSGDYRTPWTRTLLVVAKPVDANNAVQLLYVGATRAYHLTIANVNTSDRGQYTGVGV